MTLGAIPNLEAELGGALKEFADETDIDPNFNRPIFPINGRGSQLTSFLRALEFEPSGDNRISDALKAFENGETDALRQIEEELRKRLGIKMNLKITRLPGDRCIIDEIILSSFGGIHERCGIKL
jgi:hypothetical protein